MTILADKPILILYYITVIAIHLAVTWMPDRTFLGWVSALYHLSGIVCFFLAGGTLEDVLLFLLFSCTVALALGYFMPGAGCRIQRTKKPDAPAASDDKEDAA